MELEEALITGAFGIFVAVVTWLLAGLREININKRERKKERINKLENLYAQTISHLEQIIRIVRCGKNTDAIDKQLSDTNALLKLLSTEEVNNKLKKVSDLMYTWSSNYRYGAPKKMNDTDIVTISSEDSKYQTVAEKIYPRLIDEISSLIKIMKDHLKDLER